MDFYAHREALLRKARFLVSNEFDAEDLVQDTFEVAWTKRKIYVEDGKMFAWLYRIMVNVNLSKSQKPKLLIIDLNDSKYERLISAQELPAIPTTKPALS